jgi:hypothetical protein
MAKHSTGKGRENCEKLVNHVPMSDVKLAGEGKSKKMYGKPFKLAGATKVEGESKKSRKKG